LKVGGVSIAVLGIALCALAAFVHFGHPPTFEPRKIELTVEVTPERVARGKVLATAICVGCHMDPVTRKLTGKHISDAPLEFGRIASRNITRHPVKGIGRWTDGELAYLLRTGVDRNGVYIPPYMSKLPHLSDEDLFSIIAFLRSEDPLVAPEAVDPPGVTEPSLLAKFLTRFVFGPLPYPDAPVPPPPQGDEVALGRYLVVNLDCYSCHSEDFKTMNVAEPEKTPGYLGGGNPLLGLSGETTYSSNITSHEGTGLGSWTREEFLRAVREGFRPDGTPLLYPMAPLPELTEAEVGAIYAYLRTVPPIERAVPRRERPSLAETRNGEEIYRYYGCRSCHGDNGVGIADLRQAYRRYPADEELRRWIENPSAIQPGTKMPTWRGVIAEEHYAPLLAYVRTLGERAAGAKPN
jgi:mono/diheme cytochrome c family protein